MDPNIDTSDTLIVALYYVLSLSISQQAHPISHGHHKTLTNQGKDQETQKVSLHKRHNHKLISSAAGVKCVKHTELLKYTQTPLKFSRSC